MRLCLISDTHTLHDQLTIPECDVLVHAGDFTMNGGEKKIRAFGEWLAKQPCKYKFVIAGNHDLHFDQYRNDASSHRGIKTLNTLACEWLKQDERIIYLEDSQVKIDGITFYGSPWQLPFGQGWAFNATEEALKRIYKDVKNVDVLITHGPPNGIFDIGMGYIHAGSQALLELVYKIKPKVHVFGHIHSGGGSMRYENNTLFVNAAMVNEQYKIVNEPLIVEI